MTDEKIGKMANPKTLLGMKYEERPPQDRR
jgi:hypothetical protein